MEAGREEQRQGVRGCVCMMVFLFALVCPRGIQQPRRTLLSVVPALLSAHFYESPGLSVLGFGTVDGQNF